MYEKILLTNIVLFGMFFVGNVIYYAVKNHEAEASELFPKWYLKLTGYWMFSAVISVPLLVIAWIW